jgi:hypothetical protein
MVENDEVVVAMRSCEYGSKSVRWGVRSHVMCVVAYYIIASFSFCFAFGPLPYLANERYIGAASSFSSIPIT